jgi:hypothetical protein
VVLYQVKDGKRRVLSVLVRKKPIVRVGCLLAAESGRRSSLPPLGREADNI